MPAIWRRRWYQDLLGQRGVMTMASFAWSSLILIRVLSMRGMGGISVEGQRCPQLRQSVGSHHQQMTGLTEPERELVVSVRGEEVHLGPAP